MLAGRPPLGGRERVAVEFEEVVGGGDQSSFRADGAASSSSEPVEAAVELHLREHGLDHWLAFSVELAAALAGQHFAHLVIAAAVPVSPRRMARLVRLRKQEA